MLRDSAFFSGGLLTVPLQMKRPGVDGALELRIKPLAEPYGAVDT
jgi:hypothetical protein